MGEKTDISWCDHTWNPWIGCQKVSPACDGCYAENLMDTRMGRVEWGGPGKGVGTRARTSASTWRQPIKWQKDYLARLSAWDHGIRALFDGDERRAIFEGWSKPARPFVFCASLADIFDNQVEPTWRRDAFSVMRETPHLVYLLLTKRPGNIVNLAEEAGGLSPNAALGTTVEDQERAINLFRLAVAARTARPLFTFASFEPLLGLVDPTRIVLGESAAEFFGHPEIKSARFLFDALRGARSIELPALRWAITGGGTDQGAYKAPPSHPDWFRLLMGRCAEAGTVFHHKQNGEFEVVYDRDRDDPDWARADLIAQDPNPSRWLNLEGGHGFHGDRVVRVRRVGKARAGRLLDGVLHDARPAVPALGGAA